MQKELKKINENFAVKIGEVTSLSDLKNLERDFLGKEGALKKILDLLKTLSEKERGVIGKLANGLILRRRSGRKKKNFWKMPAMMASRLMFLCRGKKLVRDIVIH
jgi:phenylalanyl-tRNA synthetase alpha subunit